MWLRTSNHSVYLSKVLLCYNKNCLWHRLLFYFCCCEVFSLLPPSHISSIEVIVRPAVWPDLANYWTLGKFLKPLATILLPKFPTFFGNFWKGVKIYHFSSEIIFGQLLLTFGDFFLVTLKTGNNALYVCRLLLPSLSNEAKVKFCNQPTLLWCLFVQFFLIICGQSYQYFTIVISLSHCVLRSPSEWALKEDNILASVKQYNISVQCYKALYNRYIRL